MGKTDETILSGHDVCKVFGLGEKKTTVLDKLNVKIYRGDFTVIMGSSGAGKSTLLYVLSGMDGETAGRVFYRDKEISGMPEKRMARLRAEEFGFVFQQTHLVSNLTLFENVAVAGYIGKRESPGTVRERAEGLLRRMNVENAKNRLPHQVSGGEAQRAAIARAVIGKPELLFADEPTGALNKANSEEVLNLLTDLNENGQSIVMATHDLRAAVRGTRLLYLEDGKVLDEMRLPRYRKEEARERESRVNGWLSALRW